MTESLKFIFDSILNFYNAINDKISLDIFGVTIGFYQFVLGFIIVSMLTSIFWKGAKG